MRDDTTSFGSGAISPDHHRIVLTGVPRGGEDLLRLAVDVNRGAAARKQISWSGGITGVHFYDNDRAICEGDESRVEVAFSATADPVFTVLPKGPDEDCIVGMFQGKPVYQPRAAYYGEGVERDSLVWDGHRVDFEPWVDRILPGTSTMWVLAGTGEVFAIDNRATKKLVGRRPDEVIIGSGLAGDILCIAGEDGRISFYGVPNPPSLRIHLP